MQLIKLFEAFIGLIAVCAVGTRTLVADTTYLSGDVYLQDINVYVGDRIHATGNLRIFCTQFAVIDGMISADPGVSIEITADSIEVRGSIRAGDGVSKIEVLESGTDGGNVKLTARFVYFENASIRAGNGGNAGRAGMVGMVVQPI